MFEYPLPFRLSFFYAPKILFGLNSTSEVGNELSGRAEAKKVMVIADTIVKNQEHFNEMLRVIEKRGFSYELFDKVEPEPSVTTINELVELSRKISPGAVIGVGGGSVMDAAKMASIGVKNPKPVKEYLGANLIERKGTPLICIPTTSGTGSEVSIFAVITLEDGTKKTVTSPHILPDVAIVDPIFTVTCPPKITAGCGMDALTHAIESIISTWATPLTDAIAYEATRLIFRYLRRAYYKGGDIEARYYMAMAATLAGISLCNARVVLGHMIGQTFAPWIHMPHGVSVGMALPYIMEFYMPVAEEKLAEIARVAGLVENGMSVKERAERAILGVKALIKELGMPRSLKEVGLKEERLAELAEQTIKLFQRPNSPIELNVDNVLEVIKRMWHGY